MFDSFFKYIRGDVKLRGNTDNSLIGNKGNRLMTDARISHKGQVDSLGRIYTSSPIPIFNSITDKSKLPEFWDEQLTGGATSVHDPASSTVKLRTTTASGDKAIRQTIKRFLYLTGHGLRVSFTANLSALQTNLRQRIGYFDEDDGLFLEMNGTAPRFVRRTNVTGTPVNNYYERADWDDPLDGSGPSGIEIDFTKRSLWVINFLWQGSGCVRLGVVTEHTTYYFLCLEFFNTLDTTYISNPNLPFRIELENLGATTTASELGITCATIEREGLGHPVKIPRTVNNDWTPVTINGTSQVPIIALRATQANKKAILELISTTIFSGDNNARLLYQLTINPTIVGGTWTSVDGFCEVNRTATSFSGGVIIDGNYVVSNSNVISASGSVLNFANSLLGALIDGTTTAIVVSAKSDGGNTSAYAGISYREI